MRLSATDIAIERGGRSILAGLSFEARAGAALVLTGPNGAGKSSLLRAIAGFLPLAAGAFALEGGERGEHRRTGALSRPRRCAERRADGRRESRVLGGRAGRRFVERRLARRAPAPRPRPCRGFSGARALRRTEAPRRAGAAARRAAPAVAARRADDGARRRGARRCSPAIMREHLGAGGLIVAATHAPLGLDNATTLQLGASARVAA